MSELSGTAEVETQVEAQVDDMTLLDGDDLDSLPMDSIETLAGFVEPPDGLYILQLTKAYEHRYETKGTPRRKILMLYKIMETVELSDSEEPSPEEGSLVSEGFMIPDGLKFWKTRATQLLGKDAIGDRTVGNVLHELNESPILFKARVSTKKTKGQGDNLGKTFSNLQIRVQEILGLAGEAE